MSHWGNNEEEEEEEHDELEYKSFNDHILFLIDARDTMLVPNSKGEIVIINVLKLLLDVLKSKIVSSDKSCIGAIFFGSKHKSADSTVDHLHTLLSLDAPTAQRIKQVQTLVNSLEEFHRIIGSQPTEVPAAPGNKPTPVCTPLKDAMWQCSHEFNKKGNAFKPEDFKRVWLFTNDDNPNCKFPQEQLQVIRVAKDAAETGIELSLWHMNKRVAMRDHTGATVHMYAPFNVDIFYNKLLVVDDEDDWGQRMKGGGDDGFDSMLLAVRKKEFKKRRMGSLLMNLGGSGDASLSISVQYFKTLNVTKKPTATKLYSLTNQPLLVRTKYLDGSTGEVLAVDNSSTGGGSSNAAAEGAAAGGAAGSDISTYVDVQGERVPFTRQEILSITASKAAAGTVSKGTDGDATETSATGHLKVLYFTPAEVLQPLLNLTTPYFIYPDDKSIKGSSVVFTKLLDNLHSKQLIAVGILVRTKSSAPRMVALLPVQEPQGDFTEDNCAFSPQYSGFYVIPLPYAGDIRSTSNGPAEAAAVEGETAAISDDAFVAANNLISNFQIDLSKFSIHQMYNSPSIQRFYHVVQAIALNEDVGAAAADGGGESLEALDNLWPCPTTLLQSHEVLEAFRATMGLDAAAEAGKIPAKVSKKRAADSEGNAAPTRAPAAKAARKKASNGDSDDEGAGGLSAGALSAAKEEYRSMIEQNKISKQTVSDLKAICSELGLPVSGKKDDLIQRITAACNA